MIAAYVCALAIGHSTADKLSVGQKWQYTLLWHFKSKEIDSTDEEAFDVEVTKVGSESTTLQISQKLTATIFDNQRIPTDDKAVPAKNDWALFPSGAVAFMTNARFSIESRVYRILKGVLPEPPGQPSRTKEWTVDYNDDGLGMPAAALACRLNKRVKEGEEFFMSYREKNGTNGLGHFVRSPKMPFPSLIEIHFSNTKMPGGTDIVDCDFTMKLNKPKSDKS